jgi:hypothetical protein
LQRVGTPLLGAVVLPRLSHLPVVELNPPAVTLTATPERPADQVADTDLTQPMRFPTNTVSAREKAAREKAMNEKTTPNAQVRPRTAESSDEITAVLDMSGMTDGIKDRAGSEGDGT